MWWLKKLLCGPQFRYLGITLIALGVILLIIFVPIKFWLAILGLLLVILGILLLRI